MKSKRRILNDIHRYELLKNQAFIKKDKKEYEYYKKEIEELENRLKERNQRKNLKQYRKRN